MTQTASSFLAPWSNFHVMTGSAAAALTGLMFVVITLVSRERAQRTPDGIAMFSTPTVMHFCAALLISALLLAPWRLLVHAAALIGVAGLLGLVYLTHVSHRTRRSSGYSPDTEDWIWYSILPIVAYGGILAGAVMLVARPIDALFALAGGVLLLLFIGIRNAWDIVTYITIGPSDEPPDSASSPPPE